MTKPTTRISPLLVLLLSCWSGLLLMADAQSDGDVICLDGLIMDEYCIERGTLLDNPSVETLVDPAEHTVHCLVDVGVCYNSPFHILEESPSDLDTPFGPGWAVTDNQPLMDLARSVGSCSTCTGDGDQRSGFRAAVRGEVVSASDRTLNILEVGLTGTDLCSGAVVETDTPTEEPTLMPTAEATTESPTIAPTISATTEPPTTPAPTDAPTKKPVSSSTGSVSISITPAPTVMTATATSEPTTILNETTALNCSEYQYEMQVPGLNNVTMEYVVNYYHDDATDSNNTMLGTMSVRITYPGQGWVGFAVSPDGLMIGSSALIGVIVGEEDANNMEEVTYGNVSHYFLEQYVVPTPSGLEATMMEDASIMQTEDATILEFTRLLDIGDGLPINGTGMNYFLVAHGSDNTLAYHGPDGRSSFNLTLSPCWDDYNMTMEGEALDIDVAEGDAGAVGGAEEQEVSDAASPTEVDKSASEGKTDKEMTVHAADEAEDEILPSFASGVLRNEHIFGAGVPTMMAATCLLLWA